MYMLYAFRASSLVNLKLYHTKGLMQLNPRGGLKSKRGFQDSTFSILELFAAGGGVGRSVAEDAAAIAMGRPWAFSVRARSSFSISSRVVRTSSSTSAAVRSFVGIGSRTISYGC